MYVELVVLLLITSILFSQLLFCTYYVTNTKQAVKEKN